MAITYFTTRDDAFVYLFQHVKDIFRLRKLSYLFDYSLDGQVTVSSQLSSEDGIVESDFTFDLGASPIPVGSGPKDIYNMYTPVPFSYPVVGAFHETDIDYETHYASLQVLVPKLMVDTDRFGFEDQSPIIVDGSVTNWGVLSVPSPVVIWAPSMELYDGNAIKIDPSVLDNSLLTDRY